MAKEVRQFGGSNAVIKVDSGGMAMVLAAAACAVAIFCMAAMVCVLVWTHAEISDLKNKDAIHDAYLQQHGNRINALEKK